MGLILWTILHSALGYAGFYEDSMTIPPKIVAFGVFPNLVIILLVFITKKGKAFIDQINLKTLTYFHTIRIPVEIVLFLLVHQAALSTYMSFEGTNFDIISGLTAAPVAYFAFKKTPSKPLLFWWNLICLLLLLNVVVTAVFAFPTPFQKLALDQPNIAILHFPFNLLPTLIVPMVLFAHFAALRRIRLNRI
jgi:hypothetical protein